MTTLSDQILAIATEVPRDLGVRLVVIATAVALVEDRDDTDEVPPPVAVHFPPCSRRW